MSFSPSTVIFLTFIVFSIFLVSSSSSWLLCWIGIELNTLTFIPLILVLKTGREGESAVKYFLSQTVASVVFLVGILGLKFYSVFSLVVLIALFIKMGVAPFHSWVLSVGENIDWLCLYFILTLQKVNPLVLLICSSWVWDFLFIGIIFSSSLGALLGLSQRSLRKLLIFSSINHLGWLLLALCISAGMLCLYFVLYCCLLFPVVALCMSLGLGYLSQITRVPISALNIMTLSVSLLSLGGLPPFLGFFPKWIVISGGLSLGNYFLVLFLVLISLFTLFYYLRISYAGLILSKLRVEPRWLFRVTPRFLRTSLILSFFGFLMIYLF
jgi:NADH-ubiquinone oxidoreductase chain 2